MAEMKMLLKIYKNGEQVNEITEENPAKIYKTIAEIFIAREFKNAQQTRITRKLNQEMEIMQKFTCNFDTTGKVIYTYKYYFENINI